VHERPPVLAHVRFRERAAELRGLPLRELFARIYRTNLWGSACSVSGVGSALDATAALRTEIPRLLDELAARSVLDIPCGDFGWLSQTRLGACRYIGADIVDELVERNTRLYAAPRSGRFMRLDLTGDSLPRVDVVLCRDCLVHLSFQNIFRAFANLRRSGSHYLLTTTFLDHEENEDMPTATGGCSTCSDRRSGSARRFGW
jgi:SAM-dependent methyltransferase